MYCDFLFSTRIAGPDGSASMVWDYAGLLCNLYILKFFSFYSLKYLQSTYCKFWYRYGCINIYKA